MRLTPMPAAHDRLLLPLRVQGRGLHGRGIFVAQLEDMAHFYAPQEFQECAATGTGIPGRYLPQARILDGQIALPIHVSIVIIILVGARG